jgi:hypothetical protein
MNRRYGTCCADDNVCDPTPQGIAKMHEALERLDHPAVVDYVVIADAFTPKMANGEPEHTDGHEIFLEAGADITCLCLLQCAAGMWLRPRRSGQLRPRAITTVI